VDGTDFRFGLRDTVLGAPASGGCFRRLFSSADF